MFDKIRKLIKRKPSLEKRVEIIETLLAEVSITFNDVERTIKELRNQMIE